MARTRLDQLPTEIIENIGSNIADSSTWFAFRLTCRSLCSKSAYAFGERFFTTLKFSLHPFSLEALTDISYVPHLAKHVRNVAFGVERFQICDPYHDNEVKRASRARERNSQHPDLHVARPKSSVELISLKNRVESTIIGQALSKFPKLKRVMIGDDLEVNGSTVRPSWGRKSIFSFQCLSGYCFPGTLDLGWLRTVFAVVTSAVQQLHQTGLDIGLGVGFEDIHGSIFSTGPWYILSPGLDPKLSHLKLRIPPNGGTPHSGLHDVYVGSRIRSLVLKYDGRDAYGNIMSPNSRRSWARMVLHDHPLTEFINNHKDRLGYVSIVNCSVERRTQLIPDFECGKKAWSDVFTALQGLRQLVYLNFEFLGTVDYQVMQTDYRYSGPPPGHGPSRLFGSYESQIFPHRPKVPVNLDTAKSFHATWKRHQEIKDGLKYLLLTYRTLHYPISMPDSRVLTSYLVDLRWANFKANSKNGWTSTEAETLATYRDELFKGVYEFHLDVPGTTRRQLNHIIDNVMEFPVPGDAKRKIKRRSLLPGTPFGRYDPLPEGFIVLNLGAGECTTLWLVGRCEGQISSWSGWRENPNDVPNPFYEALLRGR